MVELDVLKLDVFTTDVFSGNPLSIVLGGDELDDVQMQRIAFELGGPSTVFVLRSRKADVRFRFFTTAHEEPISGHGTIGGLWTLAERGILSGTRRRLETAVGVLPFSVEADAEGLKRVWMTQSRPLFARAGEVKEVASALGIGAESIFHEEFPLCRASTGLPCLLVPVKSLETLGNVQPRPAEVAELANEFEVAAICVYTWGVYDPESTAHQRCFAPIPTLSEDVASGMPAGALGAYLVENEFVPRERAERMVIEQGHWLGRPSRIHVRVEKKASTIRKVEVGGSARTVMKGRMTV